jgi:predicted nucleotidyltransferase
VNDICDFAKTIVTVAPTVREVWLLGSRANATARADSDWDLLVLGDKEALRRLREARFLHTPEVDCFVATNEEFVNAWGEKVKSGSMPGWEWVRLGDLEAEYTEKKWVSAEDGAGVVSRRRKAVQIWPTDGRVL